MRLNSRSSGPLLTAIVLAWATCNVAFAEIPETPVAGSPSDPPDYEEFHSDRLRADFEIIKNPDGPGWGARVTQIHDGSPLRQRYIRLEKGDIILALDGVEFYGREQFERHHSRTEVKFINVRNRKTTTRPVFLPPPGVSGGNDRNRDPEHRPRRDQE